MIIQFNEWLRIRDENLYQELNAQDVWSGIKTGANAVKTGVNAAKAGWDATGKTIGNKARNYATAGLLGAGALTYGLSGGDPNVEFLAKYNNTTPQQIQQLKQEDPGHYKTLLMMAKTDKKMVNLQGDMDKQFGIKSKLEPKDGFNWQAPDSHYQSPRFDGGEPQPNSNPKVQPKSSQDVIGDIDSILGRR
jgi:hypothetical protein